eukprot:g39509.t1
MPAGIRRHIENRVSDGRIGASVRTVTHSEPTVISTSNECGWTDNLLPVNHFRLLEASGFFRTAAASKYYTPHMFSFETLRAATGRSTPQESGLEVPLYIISVYRMAWQHRHSRRTIMR